MPAKPARDIPRNIQRLFHDSLLTALHENGIHGLRASMAISPCYLFDCTDIGFEKQRFILESTGPCGVCVQSLRLIRGAKHSDVCHLVWVMNDTPKRLVRGDEAIVFLTTKKSSCCLCGCGWLLRMFDGGGDTNEWDSNSRKKGVPGDLTDK